MFKKKKHTFLNVFFYKKRRKKEENIPPENFKGLGVSEKMHTNFQFSVFCNAFDPNNGMELSKTTKKIVWEESAYWGQSNM